MMEGIFLLLGSNLGDKKKLLEGAREKISQKIGPILQKSSVYETAAWGKTDQPSFYNQVLEIQSTLTPDMILDQINVIEDELGRVRKEKWGSRIIDIDILYYSSDIITSDKLMIPHPGIPDRRFTLVPLVEIAAQFVHPALGKSNFELLKECKDTLEVHLIEN